LHFRLIGRLSKDRVFIPQFICLRNGLPYQPSFTFTNDYGLITMMIKNHSERKALQQAGEITQLVLTELRQALAPGVSTMTLESLANRLLSMHRSTAPFKSYQGFNHAICVSINDEIVNGPPSRERWIQGGDLVSIATAAEHRGIHAKAARTFYVGDPAATETAINENVNRLLQGTDAVIAAAQTRASHVKTLNELLEIVPETALSYGLTVIRNMGGSGIGKKLHQFPPTPNSPADLTETIPLKPGLCFTLMPMFSLGENADYLEHGDGWTLLTGDGNLSAHVADTLLMSDDGLLNITRSL
jgi:methionyl aminopeptidase